MVVQQLQNSTGYNYPLLLVAKIFVHKPINNIVNNEKGNLFTDSYIILARWWNQFSQLFNVHGVVMSGRQKYIL